MSDIRLYSLTNTQTVTSSGISVTMKSAQSDAPIAEGVEVLGNKVVKFLLTRKGSDALEPEYGGVAMHYGQISQSFMPKLSMEMQNDIARCKEYIKRSELKLSTDLEKLSTIILKDIVYSPSVDPGRVDVYIEIITTKNNRAVVALSSL